MLAPTGIRSHAGPTILAVSACEDEQAALTGLFRNSQWNIVTAKTRADAITLFGDRTFPVVLCERHLPDGDWKDVLSFLTKQPFPPKLIVMDRLADDQLWSEVLNVGGFDLLAKPFTARELFRSIVSAWRNWKYTAPRSEAKSERAGTVVLAAAG